MKYLKQITILSCIIAFSLSSVPAYAVVSPNINVRNTVNQTVIDTPITVTPTPTTKTVTIKPIKNIEIKLPLKKTNALKEIDRRLAELNKLSALISGLTRITATQKETLQAKIKVEIENLNALREKVNAETDSTNLKGEKQSISDSYKIYSLYVPEVQILAHADRIITIAEAMDAKTTDTGLKAIITTAKTKAQSAIDLVIVLTPEGASNKNTLKTARDLLRESRTSLNTVFATLKGSK